jgi:CRP-like cAMP-binding protein
MKNTILLIENKAEVNNSLSRILQLANYEVIKENNGTSALETIKLINPALVLCNIKLPDMDGFSIKRALHNMPELDVIPFIFISDKYEKNLLRHAMELGAVDFLAKPYTSDELLKAIETQLSRSSLYTLTRAPKNNKPVTSFADFNDLFPQKLTKRVRKREMIYHEDDSIHYLYFVISGKIKAFKTNEYGKEYIMDIYKEGDVFGYESLLADRKCYESTMTMEDSEMVLIPHAEFHQLLLSNPELSLKFIDNITRNLSATEEKLLKLAYNSARKRVAEALLFIYKKYQPKSKEDIAFNIYREDISAITGLTVESVSRNLSSFRQEGLIETVNGTIRLLNINKLETLRN